jgi:hypothetical protein
MNMNIMKYPEHRSFLIKVKLCFQNYTLNIVILCFRTLYSQQWYFLSNINMLHIYLFPLPRYIYLEKFSNWLRRIQLIFIIYLNDKDIEIVRYFYMLQNFQSWESGNQATSVLFLYYVHNFLRFSICFPIPASLLSTCHILIKILLLKRYQYI